MENQQYTTRNSVIRNLHIILNFIIRICFSFTTIFLYLLLAYEAVDEHDKVGLQHELSLTRAVDVRHACKSCITNKRTPKDKNLTE